MELERQQDRSRLDEMGRSRLDEGGDPFSPLDLDDSVIGRAQEIKNRV